MNIRHQTESPTTRGVIVSEGRIEEGPRPVLMYWQNSSLRRLSTVTGSFVQEAGGENSMVPLSAPSKCIGAGILHTAPACCIGRTLMF